LCYLADIPLRVAASIDGPGSLLTTRYKHPERIIHEVEHNLELVEALGMTTPDRSMVLHVPDDAVQEIASLLSGRGPIYRARPPAPFMGEGRPIPHTPLVVVHPGCSMPARTYPWEMYVEVIDLLVERLGAFVVVTGVEDERPLVQRVLEHVRPENRASTLAMAGALPFPLFCALIKVADLTITNNTGPMHVSAAVKTPVIALFALTNPPEQWGPWQVPHRQLYHDVPCRICYSRICPYQHECLRLVSPPMVVNAAADLLSEAGKPQLQPYQEAVE
ncbi:MAG: glycosyltransferase family 9 protein, partial [Ktedonobacteraceae bacterium]|nr:glycosyltransferase family 9 protein [Ktedonobacteraceae bacterium]